LFFQQDSEIQKRLQEVAAVIGDLPDGRPEDIRHKEAAFRQYQQSENFLQKRLLADAWCAAFIIRKCFAAPKDEKTAIGITQNLFNDIARHSIAEKDKPLTKEIQCLAESFAFFHWHLSFPEVFARGGFDLIIGNPPWDALSPDSKEFFSAYEPRIRNEDKDGQNAIVEKLLESSSVSRQWEKNRRDIFGIVHFIKHSGRYSLFSEGNLGKGDFNVFRMFLETAAGMTRQGGFVAQFVPEGLYNGANSSGIREALFSKYSLICLYGFENQRGVWFPGVHNALKFCLYAAKRSGETKIINAAFRIATHERLSRVKRGNASRYL